MFLISHSDGSLLSPNHTPVTGWVKKAVVTADVDTKMLTENLLQERHLSYHTNKTLIIQSRQSLVELFHCGFSFLKVLFCSHSFSFSQTSQCLTLLSEFTTYFHTASYKYALMPTEQLPTTNIPFLFPAKLLRAALTHLPTRLWMGSRQDERGNGHYLNTEGICFTFTKRSWPVIKSSWMVLFLEQNSAQVTFTFNRFTKKWPTKTALQQI